MSIVCIGDSLTFGYGVNESENWVSVLATKMKEKIINKGIPGNTTTEMRERFTKDVITLKPSKVLIMGGTNDVFLKLGIDTILCNMKSMVRMCKINNIAPIILTPLPIKENILVKLWFKDMDYKEVNTSLLELRNLLVQYGNKKNIDIIDLGNILLNKIKIEEHFLEDGIHVSKVIHKGIAEIICKEIIL